MKKLFVIIIFVFSSLIFTAIVPYPLFSQTVEMTNLQESQINDFHESEVKSCIFSEPKLLDLSFNELNPIVELSEKYELVNLLTNQIYTFTRIGGTSHLDIIFETPYPSTLDWSKVPALVKLSDTAYVPASLCEYRHGYENHFCLHFKNSKTHGTNKVDPTHLKTIKKAQKLGKSYIKNL